MTAPDLSDLPPLARGTVDRQALRRKDSAWLAEVWTRGRVLVIDLTQGGRAIVAGSALVLIPSAQAPEAERWFLGVDTDGTPYWGMDTTLPAPGEGERAANLRDIGHLLDDRDAGLFTTAAALANWHASHRFTPRTGKETKAVEAGWARADDEGKLMWPRTDPAMIVLVHDDVAGPQGRCLLGHNSAWGASHEGVRRYSCLAGYVEPGESVEATVAREVDEEVGIALTGMTYHGSQSWPFPGSLMLGYLATADPDQKLRLDPEEIDEARWFTREQVAQMVAGGYTDPESGLRMSLPMRASIAFFLIERWLSGQ